MGNLQEKFISLGMGSTCLALATRVREELVAGPFLSGLLVITRGIGFTGLEKESLLFKSASSHRIAFVQKTDPSALLHLIGVAVLPAADWEGDRFAGAG